jgi:hypothetical protein
VKRLPLLLAAALAVLCPLVAQQPTDAKRESVKLALVGGDTITGMVSGVADGNVNVITDYGVIRVPVERLTDESRKKLGIKVDANVVQLQKRISELEGLVERLRAENAQLRRQPAPAPTTIQPLTGGGKTNQVTPTPPVEAGGYWISSTGKRHNARCRFYATSKGRKGAASEGQACKVCGG